jgi:alpha-beta hydrolase superfamily lysophospholipase
MTNIDYLTESTVKVGRTFPRGYHDFHNNTIINFEINRFYESAGDPSMIAEIQAVAPKIKNYTDLKREFLSLADQALIAENKMRSAYYLRIADFFTFAEDSDKQVIRKRFLDLARQAYQVEESSHFLIPYERGQLSAYRFTPDHSKGTIVFFGGFDGYQEERFPFIFFLRDAGYNVISFEGPGQGTVLEDFHLPMTPDWAKPLKAVLDYFQLEDVTLIGRSLGGCLALRAAAHEPRVRRVIPNDVMTDFYETILGQTGPIARVGLRLLLAIGAKSLVNRLSVRTMKQSLAAEWGIKQGMHVMGVKTPYEFLKCSQRFQTRDVSQLITQDILLMASAEDHYVPRHQFYDQIRLITEARSLTARLFTRHEDAQNHDQVGNMGLSLGVIVNWVENCSRAE